MLSPTPTSSAQTALTPLSQSERILLWLRWAMALGILILAIQAWRLGPWVSSWRFFALGALTALAAASVGGALGLLFGLPISSRVTVVNHSGGGAVETSAARGDWFSDNTSMEQIADWLTKIIVGLTLTQWSSIQIQFNRMAAAVSTAMTMPDPDAPRSAFRLAAAVARSDSGMVPGGVILGTYAVLGFLLVYLWSRRYLSAELAAGRGDSLKEQRAAENAFLAKAADAGAVQEKRKDETATENALTATKAAEEQSQPSEVLSRPFAEIVSPGDTPDDPWKGQFGGHSTDGKVEVTATVEELQTQKGLFAVELIVRSVGVKERITLVGKQVRIYLHPTFPGAIRVERFGPSAEIRLPLVSYEAFTLGVHLSDGRLFELDLAELPGIPEAFKAT